MSKPLKVVYIVLLTILLLNLSFSFAAAEDVKSGFFERTIAKPIQNTIDTVGSWLGLSTLREMVFEETIDPTTKQAQPRTDMNFGVIKKSQTRALIKAHYFFNFLSIFILFTACIWMFGKKAISTAIPMIRASLKQSLLFFFLSGLIIFLVLPTFIMGSELVHAGVGFFNNDVIKGYFDGTFNPDTSVLNDLGAALIRFVMIGLQIYFNIVYIVRSYIVSILFVTSPVLISFMNFDVTRNITITAFKESVSQMMLPVFHACIFWVFAVIWPTSSNLEKIVGIFLIIPIVDFFRSMAFGNSWGSRLGGMLGLATLGAIGAAAFKGYNSIKSNRAPEDVGRGKLNSSKEDTANSIPSVGTGTTIGHKVRNSLSGAAQVSSKIAATGVKATAAFAGAGIMAPAGPAGMMVGGYSGWKGTGKAINKVGETGKKVVDYLKPQITSQQPVSQPNLQPNTQSSSISSKASRANMVLTGRQAYLNHASEEYQNAKNTYGEGSIQELASKQRLQKASVKYKRAKEKYSSLPHFPNKVQGVSSSSNSLPGTSSNNNQNVSATRSHKLQTNQTIKVTDNVNNPVNSNVIQSTQNANINHSGKKIITGQSNIKTTSPDSVTLASTTSVNNQNISATRSHQVQTNQTVQVTDNLNNTVNSDIVRSSSKTNVNHSDIRKVPSVKNSDKSKRSVDNETGLYFAGIK